ncbi:DeoR family transcriptional regulator [Balneolaceae bacterium YR4-1]|uniref:DeoR family transcriptional regulator n=1 Tax=Halalkalibaculum roseum TaxID=2709311 RepID=A0A6M1SID1_9BACT|nr:DeoR family transcriptional regulator [Halalkalibaculum roseum]NGP75111.1 DeoR family transcriptional regulator [Halalkalibaculum roseum]
MFTGSKKEIIELIKRRGTLSIDEAVEQISLAKTTLREHFLQLERDGYVKRDYVRSGPGRPSLEYQLTPKGDSIFPSSESKLIRNIIHYLKSKGNQQLVEDFFEDFWDQRLKEAQERIESAGADDPESKISVLMKMLNEEGFMPEFELDRESETMTVKECNCPFREVIKETRLPCKLEQLFYRKLFSEKTERTTYIAEGDHSCTYNIPLE